MSPEEIEARIKALEHASAEYRKLHTQYQALINRGRGMLYLLVAMGTLATFILTIVSQLRAMLGGGN